jgi:hypothetical protein
VELLDAEDHGVIDVQDNLMIVLINDLFDQTIVNQDLRGRVRFPLHPDLNLPSVPMKVGAFPFVMEQAMAGINMHLFIDPDFHRMLLACA